MKKLVALTLALLLLVGATAMASPTRNYVMATGGTSGTYYPLGGDISALLSAKIPGLNITAQVTGASVENIRLIDAGDAELATVQNDTMDYAYKGQEAFADGAITSFKAIGSLYPEVIQLVVSPDSNIKTVADLKGKKISVGAPGSGTELNARHLLATAGMTLEDIVVQNLSFAESSAAFQDSMIEGFFVTSGIPNAAIQEVASQRSLTVFSMDADTVAKIAADHAFYVPFEIPAGTYKDQAEPVNTVSIRATLIVKADMPDDEVYEMTKALFDNIDGLSHAKKAEITLEGAVQGISVDFHPGAIRYFVEKGVMEAPAQ